MPRDVDYSYIEEARKPDADPFITCFECNVGSSEVIRLTDYRTSVTWSGASKTFYPFPIELPTTPEDDDTAAKTFDIRVIDIHRELTNKLRDNELQGQELTIYRLHADQLALTDPMTSFTAKVQAAVVNRERGFVTFKLGAHNWLEVQIGRRYQRLRCWHKYGSSACGYDTDRSGAIATCDYTRDGDNGCTVHGDDEEDAGLFRAHPRFFGGFPGINRQNRG